MGGRKHRSSNGIPGSGTGSSQRGGGSQWGDREPPSWIPYSSGHMLFGIYKGDRASLSADLD